ncbi:MAG: TraY domain-containing protein [Proteobacteria bacterium]|nr:TraY domain-containing protein [Pseudomonadota bacterium]
MSQPLSIRLDPQLDARLERLAKQTGRTKSFYIKQAVEDHLEDLEDLYLAQRIVARVESAKEGVVTLKELERELAVGD